jgi:hypothetical protein
VGRHQVAIEEALGDSSLCVSGRRLELVKIKFSPLGLGMGESQKKMLEGEVVQNYDSRMSASYAVNPRVVTMVVSHVKDRGVIMTQSIEHRRVMHIVEDLKSRNNLLVRRLKAIDEQINVCPRRQERQKLFAVIRDAGPLRC